ncbi:MAG: YraN family protein [Lachnospiraceae bacterium]|nr:YraN family protein [Lachnospiraceae bacterium]
MNKRAVGAGYEERAASHLGGMGYQIVCRNYRTRIGEIDLVAFHQGYLVFIEVRYRASDASGSASESVNTRKQQTIIRVAKWYLMEQHIPESTPVRFDVVAIDGGKVEVIQDAFWA